MANMTEDEIAEAIVEYVSSNEKRSQSRREWNRQKALARTERKQQQQKKKQQRAPQQLVPPTNETQVARESLFEPNVTALEEKRRRQAEKSRRAYETRLQRQAAKKGNTKKLLWKQDVSDNKCISPANDSVRTALDHGKQSRYTPTEAIRRIHQALDMNEVPDARWVERATREKKIGVRKSVFLRILSECFNIRGKRWLPIDNVEQESTDEEPVFLQYRSADELGNACLVLLVGEREESLEPSPMDAMQKTIDALAQGNVPELSWLESITKPVQLDGRKEILIRILCDCFGLQNNSWLLADEDNSNMYPVNMNKRTEDELGESCLYLIRRREENVASTTSPV